MRDYIEVFLDTLLYLTIVFAIASTPIAIIWYLMC